MRITFLLNLMDPSNELLNLWLDLGTPAVVFSIRIEMDLGDP